MSRSRRNLVCTSGVAALLICVGMFSILALDVPTAVADFAPPSDAASDESTESPLERDIVTSDEQLREVVRTAREAGPRDVTVLLDAALDSPDPLVAGNAIRALGRLGVVDADSLVVDLLDDPRPRVRQEVVVALGWSDDPRSVDLLVKILEQGSSSQDINALAIQALGRLGDHHAEEILEAIMARGGATTELERVFARQALSDLRGESSPSILEERADEESLGEELDEDG